MKAKKGKSDQIEKSVKSLIYLLESIISQPSKYITDSVIKHALSSQKRLASLAYCREHGSISIEIMPLSLTTLKAKTSTLSDGIDFHSFNHLRIQALEAIALAEARAINHPDITQETHTTQEKNKAPTKSRLLEEIKLLEASLAKHRESNFRLLQALCRSINTIEVVQSIIDQDLRSHRANQEIDGIKRTLLLNDHPFNNIQRSATILPIKPDS